MRVSKYVKVHKDVLVEYIYDDNNNIGESYKILTNVKDRTTSYIAGSGSITRNTQENQLFRLDPITNNWGLLNTTNYSFLQVKDYSAGFPVKHDTIKIHLPVNYTFGEYLGCFVKVYAFDFDNQLTYDLSNFFFDNTDVNQSYLLNFNSPPFLFNEKLWGKNVTLMVPSLDSISSQRTSSGARTNSINSNLTNGMGMSNNSPIFIDFHFITSKRTVNSVTTYFLNSKSTFTLPQTPEFENLGVAIEHSQNGDFFEIFGVYNGNIAEFKTFMDNSVQLGSRYYVEYQVTLYEQNIRGKSFKILMTDNFNEKVEYRPIIKYSTTTAVIDVEMRVIDAVDESSIYRRASYGMLQDQVAKYSLNLTKINIANASKPKIYNIKSPEGAGIFGRDKKVTPMLGSGRSEIVVETVKVNFAVLMDRFNIVAKSDTTDVGTTRFFGDGKLVINLKPFDNIVKFIIAKEISSENVINDTSSRTSIDTVKKPEYMDMTNMGEIKMVIKNDRQSFETGLYIQSNEVDLTRGVVVFKIPSSRINDIKKIAESGVNLFYITSTTESGTNVVYTGLFKMFDSSQNISELNNTSSMSSEPIQIQVIGQQTPQSQVVVKPKLPTRQSVSLPTNVSSPVTSTSTFSKIAKAGVVYQINSDSSMTISGYDWKNEQLKEVLALNEAPTKLSFKDFTLYSNEKFLIKLDELKKNLEKKYLQSPVQKEIYDVTVQNAANNPTSVVTPAIQTPNTAPTPQTTTSIDLNNIAALSDQEFTANLDTIAQAYLNRTINLTTQPALQQDRFTLIVSRAIQLGMNNSGGGGIGGGSSAGSGGFSNLFTL